MSEDIITSLPNNQTNQSTEPTDEFTGFEGSNAQNQPVPQPAPSTPPASTMENNDKENTYDIFISDQKTPLVVFFGAYSSGKSMTIVRLARFLRQNGYQIEADTNFRPEPQYKDRCRQFMESLNSKYALDGTGLHDYLLISVRRHGNPICQILEAPGEDFFQRKEGYNQRFPPYIQKIFQELPNRKIFIYMCDVVNHSEALEDHEVRTQFINRISEIKNSLARRTDRHIILYNKIDTRPHLFRDGRVQEKLALRDLSELYPGLCEIFKNNNPITSFLQPYVFRFVPFSTGTFYLRDDGRKEYTPSHNSYPAKLWATLRECLKR